MTWKPTAIDLFAGAGGATAGLRAAGFDVRVAVEIDSSAAKSYALNHAETTVLVEDITGVTPERLLEVGGLRKGDLTLLQACPPCQTWSSLGKGAADDPRNELVTLVGDFIRDILPAAFVIENVRGLRADRRLAELLKTTAELGYVSRIFDVDASSFGIPQRRKRLIVLGALNVADRDFADTLEAMLPEDFDRTPTTVGQAIGHLANLGGEDIHHRARTLGELARKRVEALGVGGRRTDLPEHLQLDCHKDRPHHATASYGRMRTNDVAPTLTTRCTTISCGTYVHPTENRGISLREAAILQTFAPDYQFDGFYDDIERQIGNAIPVRLAEAAGAAALRLVSGASA